MRGIVVLYTLCAGLLLATGFANAQPTPSAVAAAHVAGHRLAHELNGQHGLTQAGVLATLARARYQQSVIDAMTRPAEAKPWKDYRTIFVNLRRIADGIAFYRDNAVLLKRTQAQTGVPASLIVAILGVETNYGRTPTRYRVLDALTTLAFYYPPRQKYFRAELKQLFLLRSRKFPYPPDELMGSYAGAMGWSQFMPSSIAQYARDGDGDGVIDLWNSLPDIFASVANYFVAHGWHKGGPVAVPARVAANARLLDPDGLKPVYPLAQLRDWGYRSNAQIDPTALATLISLDGVDGHEVWIVFQNFYVISRYNKSPLYSLAVYQLSQAIARVMESPPP